MKIREQLVNPPDRLFHSSSILILGKPGSGKTRLASTVGVAATGKGVFDQPSPLLSFDQDNGAGARKSINKAVLIPDSFDDYRQTLEAMNRAVQQASNPPYEISLAGRKWQFYGVILDTLNRVQDIIKRDIKGGNYLGGKRLQIQDYGTMLDDLLGLILSLKELSERKPFHIVLTAQIAPEKITLRNSKKDEDESAAYYWLPSLAGKIGPKLPELVDMVITTYRDPVSRKFKLFGVDTVTDQGTFMGKLRYGDFYKGDVENLPDTWGDILKKHGVDIDNPASIGKMDELVEVKRHWSEDETNRVNMERLLTSNGVPVEYLFRACGVDGWDGMTTYQGTGKEAFALAKNYQPPAIDWSRDEDGEEEDYSSILDPDAEPAEDDLVYQPA